MKLAAQIACVTVFSGWMLGAVGCASPGAPRPPSLHLPEPVAGLMAERHGDAVELRFTAPYRSTDGMALTGPITAQVCRTVGRGAASGEGGRKACQPTQSFPSRRNVAGATVWTDVLPAELSTGAAGILHYRVEVFNVAGRSAGASDAVQVASGAAPRAVTGLRGEGRRGGIALQWTPDPGRTGDVLLRREAIAGMPAAPAKRPAGAGAPVGLSGSSGSSGRAAPRQAKAKPMAAGGGRGEADRNTVWLQAGTVGGADGGGVLDGTAVAGVTYRYTAVREQTVLVEGVRLELRSEASAPVELTLRDVYPPAAPEGLMAAESPAESGSGTAVDLVWQPSEEADLAGYNVYRLGDGTRLRLNAQLVLLPGFHDASAARDTALRYAVSAVDKAGNESAVSAAVEVHTAP